MVPSGGAMDGNRSPLKPPCTPDPFRSFNRDSFMDGR